MLLRAVHIPVPRIPRSDLSREGDFDSAAVGVVNYAHAVQRHVIERGDDLRIDSTAVAHTAIVGVARKDDVQRGGARTGVLASDHLRDVDQAHRVQLITRIGLPAMKASRFSTD